MRERERLLWNILVILLLIILGFMGFNSYQIGQKVKEYRESLSRESLGSEDPQLRETVEELESDLRERMTSSFDVNRDPLDLTQVIHSRRFLTNLGFTESPETQNKMRLSCTVIAQHPAAVIKFQGRSRVLRIGDEINGYRLAEVQRQRAILVRGNEKMVLVAEKAPESLESEKLLKEGPISVSMPDTLAPTGNY